MTATHSHEIDGVPLRPGDVICTTNGTDLVLAGQFWWLAGRMVPGVIDRVAVHAGWGGRWLEAVP